MRVFLTAAVLTVALAGCNETETYPISAAKVRSALMTARPPSMIFAGSNMVVTPTGDDDVRYTIMSREGRGLMSLVANIHAEGENESTVWVTAEPPKSNSKVAQSMAENPAIVKLYTKALRETIDAKLEKREFNMAAIQTEMVAATFQSMPKIQQEVSKQMNEASKMEREIRDYEPSSYSRPGQPANDLDKYN